MNTVTNLLTRKQVAALFQVTAQTVIRLEASGKLPAIRIGAGSVRYRRSDVEKYIADSITPKNRQKTDALPCNFRESKGTA